MVAVGLWGGLVGGTARWAWPLSFVAAMTAGSAAAMSGLSLPAVELWIAFSVAVLGGVIALRAAPPVAAGAVLSGLLALAHGYAHGAELPPGAGAVSYVTGFVLATALLHGAGGALGLVMTRLDRRPIHIFAGGGTATAGLYLMLG
jgi:urease accessory protein